MNSRLIEFDLLKLYAIFLVIWGHIIQYFLSSVFYDEPVYRFIYSFHMPLFMMISGFFSYSSMSLKWNYFIKKKIVQLLLPSFSWGIILWIWHLYYSFLNENVDCSLHHLIQILFFDFWFLKSCFLCYLLAYFGVNYVKGNYTWIIVTIVFSLFFPYYQMWIMYPCFIIGQLLKKNAGFICSIKKLYLLCALLFVVMQLFWDKTFWIHDCSLFDAVFGLIIKKDFSFMLLWSYRLYRLSIGIIGSFLFIGIFCKWFTINNCSFISRISEYGKYTLEIYVLQVLIIEEILSRYVNFDNQGFVLFNFFISPILSIVFILLCVSFVKQIRKSSFRLLLFGKF